MTSSLSHINVFKSRFTSLCTNHLRGSYNMKNQPLKRDKQLHFFKAIIGVHIHVHMVRYRHTPINTPFQRPSCERAIKPKKMDLFQNGGITIGVSHVYEPGGVYSFYTRSATILRNTHQSSQTNTPNLRVSGTQALQRNLRNTYVPHN